MNKELENHVVSSFKDLKKFLNGMEFEKATEIYWNIVYKDEGMFDGNYGHTDGGPGYFIFTAYNESGLVKLSNIVTVRDNQDNLICRNYEIEE